MEYEKEVNIDETKYTLLLKENCEFVFYTLSKDRDPFAKWGDEPNRSFNNLHGKVNPFSLFIEIEKFIKYLFSQRVSFFYFNCEKERFGIYQFFISRLIKGSKYYTTIDDKKCEFYVYKGI